jgi:hypothetical protein
VATKNNGVRSVYRASLANGNYIEFTDDHRIWNADKRLKDGGEYGWGELKTLLGKKVQQFSLSDVVPELSLIEDLANVANASHSRFNLVENYFCNSSSGEYGEENPAMEKLQKAALAGWIIGDGYYGK